MKLSEAELFPALFTAVTVTVYSVNGLRGFKGSEVRGLGPGIGCEMIISSSRVISTR